MDYAKLYSGEHLKKINPKWKFDNWSYRHSFVAKMKYVERLLSGVSKEAKILDAGCGQGLLVKEFRRKGYEIMGIDAFYGSEYVKKDNILNNSFEDDSFDLILCLDVIEHFQKNEQETLVKELTRILKPNGRIIWSIPNKSHLSSRIFFFCPKLTRTANPKYHPGDRPIKNYFPILRKHLKIERKKGISPTIPILFQLTQLFPKYTEWLYNLLEPFSTFYSWCFNVIVVGKKRII